MRQTSMTVLIAIAFMSIALALYACPLWERFWEIDGCDDRAGWWDDEAEVCEFWVNASGSLADHPLCDRGPEE